MNNIPEYSVSEITHLTKNILEENFGLIKVRGEISKVKEFKGHYYFSLKDENYVLNSVCWSRNIDFLNIKPEEGLEVFAQGKLTTYAKGSISNYQLQVEQIDAHGEGALLKIFEMVYALLIVCVFKPDKCTSCGDDGVLLSDIGDLCFNCWELKNTDETLCIGLSDGPKTYKTMNMMWDYKVYFNETTNKQRFIELIDKSNNVLETITDDVLMYSRRCYGLVLKSKIPEQFLDKFEEVEKFWTPHMDFDDDSEDE